MWNHNYYLYILANTNNKVLYIGVTNNLARRVYEHKNKVIEGFTSKYNVDRLVYYQHFLSIQEAIVKEKQMKKWYRKWKDELIYNFNPKWKDLYEEIT